MTDNKKHSGQLEPAIAYDMAGLLDYAPGAVVSRTIAKNKAGTVTLFSFDTGQELSEHTTPYDAFVQVLDGRVRLTIGGKNVVAAAGEIVLMLAGVPHAVYADERFKMVLIMIRDKGTDN
jgi:quercetin dioxygenase-like cupin family protein